MECSALDVVKLRKNLMLKVDRGNLNDRLESGVMQKFMLNNSIFEYIFVWCDFALMFSMHVASESTFIE